MSDKTTTKELTFFQMLTELENGEDDKLYRSELARNAADAELIELRNAVTVKTNDIRLLYKVQPFSLVKIVNQEMALKVLTDKLEIMETKFAALFPKTK